MQTVLDENWFFRIGAAYLDARFKQFADPFNPNSNFAGNRLPDAPEWNVSGLFQHDWPTEYGVFRAQTDFFWNSKLFFTADNSPVLAQDDYGIVNAHLYWISNDNHYQIAVWVKNIADEDYFTFGAPVKAFGWHVLGVGDPRTIGVTLSVNFD